jgi:hypothetical protein
MWEVSSDPNDPQPLSPSMLLNLKEPTPSTEEIYTDQDLLEYGKKRWRRVQYIAQHFWLQWRRDYLQTLQRRQKWLKKTTPISPDDIVLLKDKTSKRNHWPLGRIHSVKYSNDGLVRSATIRVPKTINKVIRNHYYERPISEFVLLSSATPNNVGPTVD